MAGKEEHRIFVGGLSYDVTERQLEHAFSRFGKILDSQIMLDRDTGRPRGFGFITFANRRSMDEAIREMHGQELGEHTVLVNKAEPKLAGDLDRGYKGGGYSSSGRGGYAGGDRRVAQDECFKCGRSGHWARDCPSAGGGGIFSSRSRYGGADDRGDRFGDRDRYVDDRYAGGHYGDRDHRFDSRDDRYVSYDRNIGDRYPPSGDRYGGSYGGSDRFPRNGYGKERGGYTDVASRGSNRYESGGPTARNNGRSYNNRSGPYDRPDIGGQHSSFDRY